MEAESLQTHARLEGYYWWFVGRRRVIEKILQKYFFGKYFQILDWGCGTGGNFALLSKFGQVLGVDSSDEALRFSRERGFTNLVKAGTLEEFPDQRRFDLLTCFDVLEHISDDTGFLRDSRNLLKPGGHILITVPAYQFLWSELDMVASHVRRYTKPELIRKLQTVGFVSIKASYFISILFLPIITYRFLGKLTGRAKTPRFSYIEFPKPINWLYTKLVELEAWALGFFDLPFGTSIILLARKK